MQHSVQAAALYVAPGRYAVLVGSDGRANVVESPIAVVAPGGMGSGKAQIIEMMAHDASRRLGEEA